MSFGTQLKNARKTAGLTQKQLADAIGAKHNSVSNWENDQNRPGPDTIAELCSVLNVSPNYLIGEVYQPAPAGFQPLPEMVQVPLIGSIACGTPILAEENIKSYVGVPAVWRADFALECHGDSMAPKIQDGDIVCIRKQPEVESGQIAAVRIGEEATLKHFYQTGDVVQLIAENASVCPPMVYAGQQLEEIEIEGLAVGICRGLV